jgi:hypothetical protein
MKKLSFRPSPAMIVACVALFVALGGTGLAASYVVSSNSQVGPGTISGHTPPTGKHANIIGGSINGTDLANGAVTGGKLAPNSVNGSKVANGSLTAADTDTSSIQRRVSGSCSGNHALQQINANGTASCLPTGTNVTYQSNTMSQTLAVGATYTNPVQCPSGTTLLGGGGEVDTVTLPPDSFAQGVQSSWPDPATRTWTIRVAATFSSPSPISSTVYAICASP